MSYNSQVETFVVGDLVRFTGYEVDNPPLAHRIGIVLETGSGHKPYTTYRVWWLHSNSYVTVAAKHLTLAYTKKV